MESLLIVIAIVVAVFLTARAVMQPYRPRFYVGNRLPTHGIVSRARALGKRCAATERGSGLSVGTLSAIKREYKALRRRSDDGRPLTSVQTLCLINRNAVFCAVERAKSAMRKSHSLGHADKRPRVFTLCDALVKDMRGYIDIKTFKAAINAFCEHAPLTFGELDSLADMLRLCLCGLIMKLLGDENARAEAYDDGVRDGGDGKVDIGRMTDCDYLCGVVSAITASDKSAFDALIESNAVDVAQAEKSRRKRLALSYSAALGALRSLSVADGIDERTVLELSAADKALSQVSGYGSADSARKISYLRACERGARRSKLSELAYAHNVADSAKTVGSEISEYLSVDDGNGRKPVYTTVAAALVAIIGIVICLTFSYRYAAVFPMLAIAVYAVFRPKLILPSIRIKKRKENIENFEITEYAPQTRLAYFGGEPDYKRNAVRGGIAEVTADNRGKVTVKSACGAAELSLNVSAGRERIKLAAFDGVFAPHKSTYRVATESAEFSAEFIAPVESAGCSVRVTALNRTAAPLDIGIFASADKCSECDLPQCEFLQACKRSADERCAVALCSESGCSERAADNRGAEISERFELGGYEKRAVVINALFAESAALLARRATAMCGDGGFACDEAAAREYCADIDGYVGAREYAPITTPYRRESPDAGDVELPTVAYDAATDFGGFTGDGGLLPILNGGADIRNVLCDGAYRLELASDGGSARYTDEYGGRLTRDDGLTAAFVALGEGGAVWTPTLRPMGKGNLYAVHKIGYSEYKCGYNGFICTLRRYVACGRKGELFDLTLENKTDRQRETDVMLSVRSDCVCGVTAEGGRLLATDGDGNALFCVQSSERITEYAEFAEGYFVRGAIDRTRGFRSGGCTGAPTASTRVHVLPNGSKRVVFLLRVGDCAQLRLDESLADAMLAAEIERYENGARFAVRTSDRALNRAFMWVQYALTNAVKDSAFISGAENAALDIVLCRAARYLDIAAVRRKISCLCENQRADGASGYADGRDGRSVAALLALPIIAASYIDFTRDFGVLGEHTRFYSETGEKTGASVLEHCLRAVDCAVRVYASGKKSVTDAMLLRFAVKRYVQYCAESARKKRFEAAVRYADYAVADGFDGEKFGEYAGVPINDKIVLLPQVISAVTGACGADAAKTALATAKDKLFDGAQCTMRTSSETDERATLAIMLLYAYALYKVDCDAEAFDVLRECYRRGAVVCESIGAQALFYSLVAEYPLGVKLCGGKITVNPAIGDNAPDIAFDIATARGRAHVTVDGAVPRGAWRMRVNNVVYSTDAIDVDSEGESNITLFRNGADSD